MWWRSYFIKKNNIFLIVELYFDAFTHCDSAHSVSVLVYLFTTL